MKLHLWAAVVGVLGIGAWAGGDHARADDGPLPDADYLAGAVMHAASEVRAAKLAMNRTKSEEVRKFARQVLVDQEALDQALDALAVDNKVPVLANQVDGRQLSESRLGALEGDHFDREALKLLIGDLEQWIDLSQHSATGGDPAESELAAKMLPTLPQRLREANRLLKTVP